MSSSIKLTVFFLLVLFLWPLVRAMQEPSIEHPGVNKLFPRENPKKMSSKINEHEIFEYQQRKKKKYDEQHHKDRRTTTGEEDPYFPAFHVRPKTNWVNDPNGPGRYGPFAHLWMQYNPYSAIFDPYNSSWAHFISTDLVKWTPEGVNFLANSAPYNALGSWTGSMSFVNNTPVMLFACANASATQTQCFAWPTDSPPDPRLRHWTMDPKNPIINTFPGEIGNNFRDPMTAWWDDTIERWIVGMGGEIAPATGCVMLFSSKDFSHWEYLDILYQANPLDQTFMFECPDFFELPVETKIPRIQKSTNGVHVLKTSDNSVDWVRIGSYDATKKKFEMKEKTVPLQMDFGGVYASKSYYDSLLKERIYWGWVLEERTTGITDWQSMQTIPRVISYDAEYEKVKLRPLPGLKKLRSHEIVTVVNELPVNGEWVMLVDSDGVSPGGPGESKNNKADRNEKRMGEKKMKNAKGSSPPSPWQQEIEAFFELPSEKDLPRRSTLRVGILLRVAPQQQNSAGSPLHTKIYVDIPQTPDEIDIVPNRYTTVPAYAGFKYNCSTPKSISIVNCSHQCLEDPRCLACFYNSECMCYLTANNELSVSEAGSVSGVLRVPTLVVDRSHSGSTGATSSVQGRAVLPPKMPNSSYYSFSPSITKDLSVSNKRLLKLHVFFDHSVVEVFKDDGLERMTFRLYLDAPNSHGVGVIAEFLSNGDDKTDVDNTITTIGFNATVWNVGSIWE